MNTERQIEQRFWDRVSPEPNTGCWLWTGCLDSGYGVIGGGPSRPHKLLAHRFAYELEIGPIPTGLHIDHLCRTRCCVNPRHLRPVTIAENVLAAGSESVTKKNLDKLACPKGHPLSGKNLYRYKTGRYCRTCRDIASQKWKEKKMKEVRPVDFKDIETIETLEPIVAPQSDAGFLDSPVRH